MIIRNSFMFFLAILFFVILGSFHVGGQSPPMEHTLVEGKNEIIIDSYMYAKEFLELDDEIDAVSYYDDQLDRSVGYVNVFGGIGSNFLIRPEKTYEVVVRKNITLIIQ